MAETITETEVIQIQAQDTENNRYSFNVENPKDNLTINTVREIFDTLINSGKWISKKGFPFNYIPQATVTKTKKRTLDDGTAISVTPSSITVTAPPAGQNINIAATVEGAPIKGVNWTGNPQITSFEINASTNTVNANVFSRSGAGYKLIIITTAGNLEVPITVN